jgi:predicted negative regulator of RcsB-dependent stress response
VDDLLTEKEQIEAMRTWWQENGRYVISGIVLGVAILVGWNRWQDYQQTARLEASAVYETLALEVDDGDLDAAEAAASDLYDNYASTTYASLARLAMAKLYMEKGRDQDAADTLNALLEVRGDSELQMVARLRLAKVHLYQNKPQEVLDSLAGYDDSAFSARFAELLGDAHAELGQIAEATAAYQRAMIDDPQTPTVNRALIQMKLVDLPEVSVEEGSVAEADSESAEPESSMDDEQ